jgi:NADH:ubiquinone oxidoreductase subunit F (NADH-binding)
MNESVDVNAFLNSCMKFFLHETCGNCNPCRNGLKIIYDITERLKKHQAYTDDINAMEEISMMLKISAFCPLGQSPAAPIMSAIRYFRPLMEQGIDQAAKKIVRHNNRELIQLSNP